MSGAREVCANACIIPASASRLRNFGATGCKDDVKMPGLRRFGYDIGIAHNGCVQLEVTLIGRAAHAALPANGAVTAAFRHCHICRHRHICRNCHICRHSREGGNPATSANGQPNDTGFPLARE
ncbi:MAG TPA: hypothetical protein VIJ37_06690 [Steroidobacteraceae bacterium]